MLLRRTKYQSERRSPVFYDSFRLTRNKHSFFRYCYEHFSPNAAHVPADELPIFAPRQSAPTRLPQNGNSSNFFSVATAGATNGAKGDEEIEMITDFSWRNFFAVINVVKIMHKITKSNPSRILQLVHHKTSVRRSIQACLYS
jgi:hypothetical protein